MGRSGRGEVGPYGERDGLRVRDGESVLVGLRRGPEVQLPGTRNDSWHTSPQMTSGTAPRAWADLEPFGQVVENDPHRLELPRL